MTKFDGLVLVVGASGGVGLNVVRALHREGIPIRVLLRDSGKAAPFEKLGAEVVIADVTDADKAPVLLKKAMVGVKAVISALGTRQFIGANAGLKQVDYYGTRRLVDAAKVAGVEHYILNSTMGVAERRSILKPFSIPFYPKWQAEEYLVKSGLTYTIIRPGGLVDKDEDIKGPPGWTHKPALAYAQLSGEGGFNGLGRVLRLDVAEAMVKSLGLSEARNKIFDILDYASVKPSDRAKIIKDLF